MQVVMFKKLPGEAWKQIQFAGYKDLRKKYAVSNQGRAASYVKGLMEDGKLLKGSLTSGYATLNLHIENGNGTIYIHREVAKLFCAKKSSLYQYVIHQNHNKQDNHCKNLRWATAADVSAHQQSSPGKLAYKERQASKSRGLKLNAAQVKNIKAALHNPKRKLTYKQIAEKYDVSEMTLYRIRSGENWGRI